MDVKPIRSDADLNWALAEVEQYFDTPPAPGTPEADRFDVLTDLIEAFEDKHYPIGAPDPVEMIRGYMIMRGFKQADLGEVIGGKSRASEVMNRKRRLTLPMIQRINSVWKIPAEPLIAPYHLDDECQDSGASEANQPNRLRA